jgi:hypothetical protein
MIQIPIAKLSEVVRAIISSIKCCLIRHRFGVPALLTDLDSLVCSCHEASCRHKTERVLHCVEKYTNLFAPWTADWRCNIHRKWTKWASRPCHSSSGLWPASHHGGPCSIPGQVMWDLWCIKGHWDSFSVSTLVPTANSRSTDGSTLIHQPGPHSRPASGRSGRRTNSHPTPQIKKVPRTYTWRGTAESSCCQQSCNANVWAGTVDIRVDESSEWNLARWKELVPFH